MAAGSAPDLLRPHFPHEQLLAPTPIVAGREGGGGSSIVIAVVLCDLLEKGELTIMGSVASIAAMMTPKGRLPILASKYLANTPVRSKKSRWGGGNGKQHPYHILPILTF